MVYSALGRRFLELEPTPFLSEKCQTFSRQIYTARVTSDTLLKQNHNKQSQISRRKPLDPPRNSLGLTISTSWPRIRVRKTLSIPSPNKRCFGSSNHRDKCSSTDYCFEQQKSLSNRPSNNIRAQLSHLRPAVSQPMDCDFQIYLLPHGAPIISSPTVHHFRISTNLRPRLAAKTE